MSNPSVLFNELCNLRQFTGFLLHFCAPAALSPRTLSRFSDCMYCFSLPSTAMQTLLRSIALNLIYLSLAQPSPAPFQVQWNTKTFFGPDGPWQAVPVNLGTADPPSAADSFRSSISLYPGGTYGHTILTTAFCNSSTSCPASSAGLYNQLNSPSSDNHSVSFQSGIDQWDGKEAMNLTGAGIPILDTITITSAATSYPIPKSIFTAVGSSVVSLPDNSFYSTQVGFLSLGAPNLAQKFNLENGSAVVANLLTG